MKIRLDFQIQKSSDGSLWLHSDAVSFAECEYEKGVIESLITAGILSEDFCEELSGKETVEELVGMVRNWERAVEAAVAKANEFSRYYDMLKARGTL